MYHSYTFPTHGSCVKLNLFLCYYGLLEWEMQGLETFVCFNNLFFSVGILSAWFHKEWCTTAVQSIRCWQFQPYGVESLGKSLLLQKGEYNSNCCTLNSMLKYSTVQEVRIICWQTTATVDACWSLPWNHIYTQLSLLEGMGLFRVRAVSKGR